MRLEAVSNILEVASSMSFFINPKYVAPGKSKYQAPFRDLLFAITVRCARLFEEVDYQLIHIVETQDIWKEEGIEKIRFIRSKRQQISRVQELLEKKSLVAAIEGLVKTNTGLKEFEGSIDAELQKRMKDTGASSEPGGVFE